ncbi:hypothetical protein lerEdw1_008178 [Lerista edwardsae]|nr:hypothetical protein lerEdw1_008178 [Lerista edwardsae]
MCTQFFSRRFLKAAGKLSIHIVVKTIDNKEVYADYKSVEDQFNRLRRTIADVRHHDEFQRALRSATLPVDPVSTQYLELFVKAHSQSMMAKSLEHLYTRGTRTRRSWLAHARNMYYLSKGKKSWYDAEKFCMSRVSHLTSILSEEEQKFITSQVKYPIWIGLRDEKETGMWEWSDSSRFTTQ